MFPADNGLPSAPQPATLVLCSALFLIIHPPGVHAHGRMLEPPARNSMWRVSYDTPPNFEDSELFCGGIKAQWEDNGGKCGVCGDNYAQPRPRRHETGSMYARNVTVRRYAPGALVDIAVELETNHLGHFEFSICPRRSWEEPESDECFDRHLLPVVTASGPARKKSAFYSDEPPTRYRLPTAANGLYLIQVQLPEGVTCEHCVLRWHWRSANNWGDCGDGTMALGCGPQETYRNCADVAIQQGFGLRGPLGANARPKRLGVPALKSKPNDI
ncbi:uncharacterized protein LOC144150219 [Haemaphysalis longicornis]